MVLPLSAYLILPAITYFIHVPIWRNLCLKWSSQMLRLPTTSRYTPVLSLDATQPVWEVYLKNQQCKAGGALTGKCIGIERWWLRRPLQIK